VRLNVFGSEEGKLSDDGDAEGAHSECDHVSFIPRHMTLRIIRLP
jgi:hypothetical protein